MRSLYILVLVLVRGCVGFLGAWLEAVQDTSFRPLREAKGVRFRHGTAGDAPRIRELWQLNDEKAIGGPHALMDAWSTDGIEAAFASRTSPDSGNMLATSIVAYDASRSLVGFVAANSPDEPFNVGSTEWRQHVDSGPTRRALYGPVCVAAERRGTGLFQDLFEAMCVSPDMSRIDEVVTIVQTENTPSLRAHLKLPGARERGHFVGHNGKAFKVLTLDLVEARAAFRVAADSREP